MYYASFGMLAIVIHLIINFEAIKNPNTEDLTDVKKRYRSFLIGIMFYYITDVLWGFLFDLKIVPLVYADTFLYFFSMVLSLLFWTRFTVAYLKRNDIFSAILTYTGWILFTLECITLIVNFFVPIMFSFKPDGEYLPGKARYINLGVQFFLYVALTIYTMVCSVKVKGQDRLHHRAIGFSGIVMTVFIVLQTKYPLLPFYAIGCLIANCTIHTFVEVDEKVNHDKELGSVKVIAYKDPLTNVKNANAYQEDKNAYCEMMKDGSLKELGIVVFDLNNLKSVNDTLGHDAGDKYLKESSKLICRVYKHSPVYRIGGDEFVTFLEGEDYANRAALLRVFNAQVDYNIRNGGPVVAGGMSVYYPNKDRGFDEIFERADVKMYKRKKQLKGD